MFRILSIDGGGIRGIIPAKILALLEEELGASVRQLERLTGISRGIIQFAKL